MAAQANTHGYFTDTVIIDNNWGDGQHTIVAEDALTHKPVTYPIMINAKGISLRPPHLRLSTDILDLGSGDPATTDTRTVTLINTGGGQISWQAIGNQSWLQTSPSKGIFSSSGNSGMQVKIAVDRSKLKPGKYSDTIVFSSSAGIIKLPIKMQVTAFQPNPAPALQITPALLTFTGVDGGPAPTAQKLTVSNPGAAPLYYQATTNVPWLTLAPNVATVDGGSSQQIAVGVDNKTLLPGTYEATLSFTISGSNATQVSTQSVYVSVTITPQCSLQVTPAILSFAATAGRGNPGAKAIGIGVSQNCSTPVNWSATSSDSWLLVSSANGNTPASPMISITTAGLIANTYHGTVTISSPKSTQTVAVTLSLSNPAVPVISTAPSSLTFTGAVGQGNPTSQAITISNSGGAALNWSANASTGVGGNWLNVQPSSGTIPAGQSDVVNINPQLLSSLTPGNYTGTISISGTDSAGNTAASSPQNIPVTLTVTTQCSVTTTPNALTFNATAGQTQNPGNQTIAIVANGTCAHPVNWTDSAATQSGQWLAVSSASGQTTSGNSATLGVNVTPGTLAAGNYTGTITITPTDSVTNAPIGAAQTVSVTLNIQATCNLLTPSVQNATFTATAGSNPAAQTFSVGVSGNCGSNVTVSPTVTLASGAGWLAVGPATGQANASKAASFTMNVIAAKLAVGTYTATIALAGTAGTAAITNSPQTINVTLTVTNPASIGASPTSISANVTTGTTTQAIALSNSGGTGLNWSATLSNTAPAWISLSSSAGSVAGGASATLTLTMNATGVVGGKSYTTNVTITATDPSTGNVTAGSPITIPVTVNVAAPALQVSANTVTYSANQGGANPQAQIILLNNTGGNTLNWSASKPSQSWLSATPGSGSDVSQASSSLSLPVTITGLSPGSYTATVAVTPSVGSPITITVTVTINPGPGATPTPTPQPTPTPTPQPTPTPTPQPTPTPVPQPSPTPTPDPTPRPTPKPDPTPQPTPKPDPTPQPSPTPDPTPIPDPTPSPVPTTTPEPTVTVTPPIPTTTPEPTVTVTPPVHTR